MRATWQDESISMDIKTRTVAALKDPDNWPSDLGLPLIKRVRGHLMGKDTGVAVPTSVDGGFILYRDANIFEDPMTWKDKVAPLTAEEIVAEGWEVD